MAKLPILMYHHVSTEASVGLTISVSNLESQFKFLSDNRYRSWHFSELEQQHEFAHKKNVVITFDDAYVSQLELAVPLLKKYGLKATFFVPLGYLGRTDAWNTSNIAIMTAKQLNALDPEVVELGYHSYYHRKYNELTLKTIAEDSMKCFQTVFENKLNFSGALAYPYGNYPRDAEAKQAFFKLLKEQGYSYGLRIGNRLNTFPFKQRFEIQRLDIKGDYSLAKFQRKLRFGKLF
jgi:peptidoglycan/xylan/chitin deacetylase (PgdA/CDA1 family)